MHSSSCLVVFFFGLVSCGPEMPEHQLTPSAPTQTSDAASRLCSVGPASDCRCIGNTRATMDASRRVVSDCTPQTMPPRSVCCTGLNGQGLADTCSCTAPQCAELGRPGEGGYRCECSFSSDWSGWRPVSRCAATGDTTCRKFDAENGGHCACANGATWTAGSSVASCTTNDITAECGSWMRSTSCGGLTYTQAGTSRAGAQCSFDSQCSSRCSDCPACRGGACRCGVRGASGACIN